MLLIPAIEWDRVTITGIATAENPTISNVNDTSEIVVGQVIASENFSYNTRVISKTVDSITLDSDAISSDSDFEADFYTRYEFQYPPTTDQDERGETRRRVAESLSGERQTVIDFIELKRSLTFGFVTPEDKEILEGFFYDFAVLGKKFRYFEDLAFNEFVNYENDTDDFSSTRQVKKAGSFLYEISFQFRRVK